LAVSLRSRLWLSYALVTCVALGVVSIVLLIYIVRNPYLYRQDAARLMVAQSVLLKSQDKWTKLQPEAQQAFMDQLGATYDTRILTYDNQQQVKTDSGRSTFTALRMPRFPRLRNSAVIRDSNGTAWLYILQQLDNNNWLMVSVPRPNVPLRSILRDDLFIPVVGAGITALFLSLILAFILSKWVGDPLQRMVTASKEMPDKKADPLKVEGPREVQDLIHVFNDMTGRIQDSQRSQQQFVANVSHELKTPITVIQGFAQAILDGTADSPESEKQAAQMIFDESGRMHRLVLDLLDLARLDAGTLVLKHELVDIQQLLGYIVERFQPRAQQANIGLKLSVTNIPRVFGDSDRLAQVFTNLVDNALKYTLTEGNVDILASSGEDHLRVEVKDTGVGIPEGSLPHIFDRFYQADPSRMGGEKHGAGLGLAIVREIVQAHHGTITAQSIMGQGSKFTVILPLASSDASTIVRRRKTQ
jgi:signal transduction histidine kinase